MTDRLALDGRCRVCGHTARHVLTNQQYCDECGGPCRAPVEPPIVEFLRARQCIVDDCDRTGKLTRGMCAKHYRAWLDRTPKGRRPVAPRFARDFWDLVEKTHELGCWIWRGSLDRKGYGRWSRKIASRHSWHLANGPIPDGLWVLHLCDNKPCVNPRHLYLGTVVENARDASARGQVPRVNASKDFCPSGHPYVAENLYVVPGSGHRQCKECNRKRSRDRQRRIRAEARRAAS